MLDAGREGWEGYGRERNLPENKLMELDGSKNTGTSDGKKKKNVAKKRKKKKKKGGGCKKMRMRKWKKWNEEKQKAFRLSGVDLFRFFLFQKC